MPLRSNKVSKFCSKQKFNNTINTDKNEYKSQLKSTPDLRSAINSQSNGDLFTKNNSKKPHKIFTAAASKINLNRSRTKPDKTQRSYSNPRPEISRPILATTNSQLTTGQNNNFPSLSLVNNNTTTTTSGANNGQRLSRPTPPPVPLSLQTPEIKMNTSQPTSVMGNDELGIWIEKPIVSVKAEDKTILNQLMNCNLKSIHNCSICNKPMSVNERYDLVDQVVHRNCFKCSVCSQTLTDKSAIFQNGYWCCAVHYQYNLDNTDVQLK